MKNDLPDLLPEFLTTAAAAKALGRKTQTLLAWAAYQTGPIRPIHIGRRLGWKLADIEKLLGSRAFRARPHASAIGLTSLEHDDESVSEIDDDDVREVINSDPVQVQAQEVVHDHANDQQPEESNIRIEYLKELGGAVPPTPTDFYRRGDLLEDVKLKCPPYRIERVLVDRDTQARFYILRRVDVNRELMRSHEVIENPECYRRYEAEH